MESITSNRLLACLPPELRARLLSKGHRVELPLRTVLYQLEQQPTHAFFLESGFASQVISAPGVGSVEVGMVAREGVVGAWALLGPAKAVNQCFMQAEGAGWTLPFEDLHGLFRSSDEIRTRVLEYLQQDAASTSYLAACNKLHRTEARLARWLLMVQDRLEADVYPLTQEFLAQMLGTRRMTVTTTAGALQREGLIEYARGQVRILNRTGLEAKACECYGHLRRMYSGLYRGSAGVALTS